MAAVGVNAATDVTGYGLVGHLLEMCDGAGISAELNVSAVPVLDRVREYQQRGFVPSGTARNVATFRRRIRGSFKDEDLTLMCDAQTSGGLLIAVASDRASALEDAFRGGGLFYAKIGRMTAGPAGITLLP